MCSAPLSPSKLYDKLSADSVLLAARVNWKLDDISSYARMPGFKGPGNVFRALFSQVSMRNVEACQSPKMIPTGRGQRNILSQVKILRTHVFFARAKPMCLAPFVSILLCERFRLVRVVFSNTTAARLAACLGLMKFSDRFRCVRVLLPFNAALNFAIAS